jgi:soluble lytic murein transglycosylase-like protein
MQVLPSSGKLYAGYSRDELFCPEKNIIAGTKILKHYQRTSPNLESALAKYSGNTPGYYERVKRRM